MSETPVIEATDVGPHTNGTAPPDIVVKSDTTKEPGIGKELLRSDAGTVEATTVTMDRSGAESITADRVTMDHSGSRTLESKSAQLTNSGVVVLNSERAVMQGGSALLIKAAAARIIKSKALAIVSDNTTVEGELKTILHIGPVSGDLRPVLDTKGAAGLGAGLGIALLLARVWRRRSSGV